MTNNRLQWFLDRIGKIVYRNKNKCTCELCKIAYENGLEIIDEQYADYLFEVEQSDLGIKYFDTKHEVEQFERERK